MILNQEKISAKIIGATNELTDPELGLPNLDSECRTCGAKDVKTCEGHFGLIRLPFTILHPYFLPDVAHILNKVCPGCKSIRRDKVKTNKSKSADQHPGICKYCDGCWKDMYPTMKFKVSSKDLFGKTAIIAEANETFYKRSRNRGGMACDYWDCIPRDAQQDESSLRPNKRVLSHAQVYHILKEVDPTFLEEFVRRRNSIFLNCFPVTPNCLRVSEFAQHMIFEDCRRAYRPLIDFKGSANELSTRIVDCLKMETSKNYGAKSNDYENRGQICSEKPSTNRPTNNDSAPKSSGLKFIKELLLGKRTDHAFRMVVVGDPNIQLGEIGIPCHIAETMEIPEHLNSWNREKLNTCFDLRILEKGSVFVRRNSGLVRLSFKDKLQAGDTMYRPLNDGDIVLINRPPSIHPHSLIALSVKILPTNSVLSVNPLICSPLRGDFDGDCLHGYVPQSIESRVELRELVALNKQLINGQSGRNLLSVSHDSLTAAHLLVEDGVVLNTFQIQQLQMFCPHKLESPTIIKTPSLTSCLWTGKQLFSSLLPSDFDYELPSNGIQITRGELISSSGGSSWLRDADENLFYNLVKHYQGGVLDFLYAAQEVLCEWLSMRGLSVSLLDLYLCPDPHSRNSMMEELSCGLREAERVALLRLLMVDSNEDFLIGDLDDREVEEIELAKDFEVERMCYERQKSAALSRASVSAFKQVFWDIQNLFYHYAGKDNSFLTMLKAGSKGNLLKVVQHSMCLGLQNSLKPLPFKLPHRLSCVAWNKQKKSNTLDNDQAKSYISYAVVENSFLTGLNPLECFVHSLTTRDNSFGGHADISGTLTRRLMFFMRDLYIGYDGTVRNAYGNQIVQFSYITEDISSPSESVCGAPEDTAVGSVYGAKPVGSLAACALSEVAYSALDQPKVLECGVKKISGDKTVSLFLSKKLGRWIHGYEYGALAVKNHLENVLFSDIVSTVTIFFTPQASVYGRTQLSPWEIAKKKRLRVQSIIDALNMKCNSAREKSKTNIPNFQITRIDCSGADMEKENAAKFCITVTTVASSNDSSEELDTIRDTVIPFLLGTVIKGSSNVKKVDILWKDCPYASRARQGNGELYLRVFMSANCDRKEFWRLVKNDCLQIMDMIDWEKSHPDDIHDITLAYGIDVAWECFLSRLKSAVSDTGKTVLQEHLVLATDSLSFTGEFVGLSAKGLAQQRKQTSVSSPFMKACFSNPSDSFIKAAKMGTTDNLQGSLDALSWGNVPSMGTGGKFDILYSGKGHELAEPEDIYSLLGNHNTERNFNVKIPTEHISGKNLAQRISTYGDFEGKGHKQMEVSKAIRKFITSNDIHRLSLALKHMLHKYTINHELSETDKSIVMTALYFHPRRNEKIGIGIEAIKVGYHSKYGDSRCFLLVREDGTVEDFSYHKCVHHAMELIDPKRAEIYQSRWLNRRN
ncbi:hypothetical protein LguiA_015585 [Lonicera macranthoides]